MTKQRIAIVPGSFDPITNGHIDIIRRAAELYDRVFVAVMINDQKKYRFTLEEREAIARAATEDMERVEVISSSGWLWELARDLGACAIVKGYRNETDLEYEKKMAEFNCSLQDPDDGYIYHPQWGKNITDHRRGRDRPDPDHPGGRRPLL